MSNQVQASKPAAKNAPPAFNRKGGITPKKKGKGGKIALLVILLLVGGAAVFLYMNIFNIRDMTFNLLRNVPLVGSLIPAAETEEPGKYDNMTFDELATKYESLEREIERLKTELSDSKSKNDLYVKEISRLSEYEDMQEQFKLEKDLFDREAFDADPQAFRKYYEQVSPQNAEIFYKEAVLEQRASAEVRTYLDKIAAMDERSAAKALEELIPTDINLVAEIMRGLGTDQAGMILENMTAANAAIVIKMTYPN